MTKKPIVQNLFINSLKGRSFLVVLLFSLLACNSREEKLFNEAQNEIENKQYKAAISQLEKITLTSPQTKIGRLAAKEGARIAFFHANDFPKAIYFYQMVILNSEDAEDRIFSQKQVVAIYFDHLNDYPKSVLEINKLIPMLSSQSEKTEYKMKLARAYYYQNNFTQAENEVDEFLKKELPIDIQFDMYLLKGNINLAEKNLASAIEIFKKMMVEFPERSAKENIGLTLSVCYEELKDFKSAIELLEKIKSQHPMPEYIDIRIKRLQDRLKNQPGARGRYRK